MTAPLTTICLTASVGFAILSSEVGFGVSLAVATIQQGLFAWASRPEV